MKTLASALIALSVLIGVAAPASALDARKFFDQLRLRGQQVKHMADHDHANAFTANRQIVEVAGKGAGPSLSRKGQAGQFRVTGQCLAVLARRGTQGQHGTGGKPLRLAPHRSPFFGNQAGASRIDMNAVRNIGRQVSGTPQRGDVRVYRLFLER